MARTVDVAELIGRQKFGAFHVRLIALCLCVQFLDGFDTQALAFAGPALLQAWNITPKDLGAIAAAGALGTGIGSAVLGPLADIFGRKAIMITAVTVFGLLTFCTVLVTAVDQLTILRLFTGFGLGAALPLTFVMANEFAPTVMRARMIAAMACGFAIGAASGGLLQAAMRPVFGWQGIFFVGGVIPLILAVVLAFFLPESVRFLAARGGRSSTIAKTLKRIDPKTDYAPDTVFVLAAEPKKRGFQPQLLFTQGRAVTTTLLWLTFFVCLISLNTLVNLLPVALSRAALQKGQPELITTLFQFGGIAGVFVLGALADRVGYHRVLMAAFAALALCIAATGSAGGSIGALAATIAGTGFFLVGANNTLNAFATTLYPTEIRSTGVSWASSFGRLTSSVGPLVGGILLTGLPLRSVFFLFAIPAAFGALCVLALSRTHNVVTPDISSPFYGEGAAKGGGGGVIRDPI